MGEYDLTLGALLVGLFFNTYLFGIVTVQFITYYDRGFKDPWGIRLAVALLVIIDVFHSSALMYMGWQYFVTNFNNPPIISVALWPHTFTPIGTAMAAIVTHVFLSHRIYQLTKLRWLFAIFIIGALASFSTGVASGIKAWLIKDMTKLSVLNTLAIWWLTIQMVLDTTIAFVMAWVLWAWKTGYKKTDSAIHKLIRCAIQTGVFATVFAAGDLICFIVIPQTQLFGMFAMPLGRIYTNTMMHTLNMRGNLQGLLHSETLTDPVELTTPSFRRKRPKSIQIRVQGSVTTRVDGSNDFTNPQGEGPSTQGGGVGVDVKLPPVNGPQSITSETDFAVSESKHHPI